MLPSVVISRTLRSHDTRAAWSGYTRAAVSSRDMEGRSRDRLLGPGQLGHAARTFDLRDIDTFHDVAEEAPLRYEVDSRAKIQGRYTAPNNVDQLVRDGLFEVARELSVDSCRDELAVPPKQAA
jgi:hypothetical protein